MKYAEYVISGWVISFATVGLYWAKQQRALRAIKHTSGEPQSDSDAE